MKHLIKYKLFESTQTISYIKQLEIAEFLRDLTLELWDDNFNVQVSHTALRNADDIVFTVNIVKRGDKKFLFDNVKEVVKSMQNYMESEGFMVSQVEVCDACYRANGILKDGELLSKKYGEEINYLIGVLTINFSRK